MSKEKKPVIVASWAYDKDGPQYRIVVEDGPMIQTMKVRDHKITVEARTNDAMGNVGWLECQDYGRKIAMDVLALHLYNSKSSLGVNQNGEIKIRSIIGMK